MLHRRSHARGVCQGAVRTTTLGEQQVIYRLAIASLSLLTLAACADDPAWTNPSLPKARWDADLTDCRRQADDTVGAGSFADVGDPRGGIPMPQVDHSEDRARWDASVASCMKDLGYHRVK